jgi:hypothetical protein
MEKLIYLSLYEVTVFSRHVDIYPFLARLCELLPSLGIRRPSGVLNHNSERILHMYFLIDFFADFTSMLYL